MSRADYMGAVKLDGLWPTLTAKRQRDLMALGFDQASWDNNCREYVPSEGATMVRNGGGDRVGLRFEVMTGDRLGGPCRKSAIAIGDVLPHPAVAS